jgi:hypothetical protein
LDMEPHPRMAKLMVFSMVVLSISLSMAYKNFYFTRKPLSRRSVARGSPV